MWQTSLLNHHGVRITVIHPATHCQGCRRATLSKVRPPNRHGHVVQALGDVLGTHSLLRRIEVLCTMHLVCLDRRSASHPAKHSPRRCVFLRASLLFIAPIRYGIHLEYVWESFSNVPVHTKAGDDTMEQWIRNALERRFQTCPCATQSAERLPRQLLLPTGFSERNVFLQVRFDSVRYRFVVWAHWTLFVCHGWVQQATPPVYDPPSWKQVGLLSHAPEWMTSSSTFPSLI